MSNFSTGVGCSGHLQIVLQQAYQYKLKSTKNIKSSLTLVFECKGSKWRKRLRNCIKHVKRKKDCFQASHRAVAEIQGKPTYMTLVQKVFVWGEIIVERFVFQIVALSFSCQSGWMVAVSSCFCLWKAAGLWNKQKWKLQSVDAKLFVCGTLQQSS